MSASPVRTLRARRIGNSVGVTFPKDLRERYGIEDKSSLHVVETKDGLLLTRYDTHFQSVVEAAERVEEQFKNTFRELAR